MDDGRIRKRVRENEGPYYKDCYIGLRVFQFEQNKIRQNVIATLSLFGLALLTDA